jgi:hypothetical protein
VQSEKQLVAAPLLGAVRVTAILLAITPSVALGTQDTLHHTIYRSIDYPGAVSTLVSSVDNNGDLAGLYSDSAGKKHILALINGSLIAIPCAEALGLPIIVSQSGAVYVYYSGNPAGEAEYAYDAETQACKGTQYKGLPTEVSGANVKWGTVGNGKSGTTPARYSTGFPPSLQAAGYLRKPGGKFVTIDVPDAQYGVHPMGLNNKNVVTGDYDGVGGFVWPLSTLTATEFACSGEQYTLPAAINDKGVITGECGGNLAGDKHGFVRDVPGNITKFDPTGSYDTVPKSINVKGVITGSWGENNYPNGLKYRGFIRSKTGSIKAFDYPHASGTPFGTYPLSINDNGVIVGYYVENGVTHGFERDP